MRKLPEGLSRATRRHYAGLIHRVLNLAELAGYIARNPLPRGWLPKLGGKKRFPILYPGEDRTLLAAGKPELDLVDLRQRQFHSVRILAAFAFAAPPSTPRLNPIIHTPRPSTIDGLVLLCYIGSG